MRTFKTNFKKKTWKSKKYREFVARKRSFLSGENITVVPHHHRKGSDGGTGLKPSDIWCVPVTHIEHAEIHAGNIVLDDEEVKATCIKLMTEYLVENNIR